MKHFLTLILRYIIGQKGRSLLAVAGLVTAVALISACLLYTSAVAVVCLLFLGLILLQTHYAWTRLHHVLTERNLALLGNLLELYPEELRPEAEAEIVRAFTREAEAAAQEAGQAAAAAYGYSRDLPLSTTPLLQSRYFHSIAATAALGALLLAALLFAIYLASARTYRA